MTALPGRAYFRQRQRNQLYEAVVRAVEDAAARTGIRKRDVAEKAGVSPPQLSRWLSGPSNWTMDSVSDVLYALGMELRLEPTPFAEVAKGNRLHDVYKLCEDGIKAVPTTASPHVHITVPGRASQATTSAARNKITSARRV